MATMGGCLPDANIWRNSTFLTILLIQVSMATLGECLPNTESGEATQVSKTAPGPFSSVKSTWTLWIMFSQCFPKINTPS
jgi:hypothetical protein